MAGARTPAIPAILALILVCTAVWDIGHSHRRPELQNPQQDLFLELGLSGATQPLCPACLSTHHGAPAPEAATPLHALPDSTGGSAPGHVPIASRIHVAEAPRAPPDSDIARA
jgi:hypothetical protein